jgi:hypothetical protein
VSDGIRSANITLLGHYATGDFVLASDGNGGSLITAPSIIGLEGGSFLTANHPV